MLQIKSEETKRNQENVHSINRVLKIQLLEIIDFSRKCHMNFDILYFSDQKYVEMNMSTG